MKFFAIFLAIFCALGASACSEDVAQAAPKMPAGQPPHQVYREWHDLCLEGKKNVIEEQIDKFLAVLKKNPNDHLARAYLGSAYALRAKAGIFGPSKLSYLNKGKKQLNLAVESAPKDLRVRTVRAIGFYRVPTRFKVRPTAVKDFEFLLSAIKKKNLLEINEKQVALYYAYLTFKEEGHEKAEEARKLCHQLAPDSKYGKLTK